MVVVVVHFSIYLNLKQKIMGCDYSLELIRASKKIFPQLKIIHVVVLNLKLI